jgi:hypothetical protein
MKESRLADYLNGTVLYSAGGQSIERSDWYTDANCIVISKCGYLTDHVLLLGSGVYVSDQHFGFNDKINSKLIELSNKLTTEA